MRGSIRPRGDGYEISVSAGLDPVSGQRRRLYRHARTKREAERELTRLLAEVDAGSFADPGRLTVAAYMRDRWLPHQRTRLRDRTWRRYEGLLDRHVLPAIGSVPMAKLRPAHVQAVVDAMTAVGLAPRTVVQGYRVLSSALRQAVRWQLLGSNPAAAASPPRPERARLSIPDADAVTRIIAASGSDWFHVAVVLAASSGMRRGEVLGLRWQDVDLDGGLVRVSSALQSVGDELVLVDPKTSRARRPIELPDGTMAMLRRLRRDHAERRLLLGEAWHDLGVVVERGDGRPIHPDVYSRRFSRLVQRLGLPAIRLHDLRHAYATRLLEAGVHPKVVADLLGHASSSFTMDTYSHVVPSLRAGAAAVIEAALGGAIGSERS
jgi:integrase